MPVTQTPTNGTFPVGSAATIPGTKHVVIAYTTHVFWPKAMTARDGALDINPTATFGQFVPVKAGASLSVGGVGTASTAMWMSDHAVVATSELPPCKAGCSPLRAPSSARYLWVLESNSPFVLPTGTPATVSLSNAEAPENHASDGATALQP